MGDEGQTSCDDQYWKDSRIACKYGVKCYQKNPAHLQKYKHPPPKRQAKDDIPSQKPTKKPKLFNFESDDTSSNGSNSREVVTTSPKNKTGDSEGHSRQDQKEVLESDSDNTSEKSEESSHVINVQPKLEELKTVENLDPKKFIREKFLVDMPPDFYEFWEFCKKLNNKCPQEALKSAHLTLVGPYDVLAGKFSGKSLADDNYLVHWRFYYDPPECQTVLKGSDSTGYHIGYFRDSPKEEPVFLVSNSAKSDGVFKVMGDNIFAAVYMYLEESKKTCNPFEKMSVESLQRSVKKRAEELQLTLSERSEKTRRRDKKIVFRSFNKLGTVVPYNRRTQLGYRSLSVTNKQLQKLLTDIEKALPEQRPKLLSQLQDVITNVTIATDECDFGSGIELGLDILAHGVDCLNRTIASCLGTNYRLVGKEEFARIAEAHMKNRRKGVDLSVV